MMATPAIIRRPDFAGGGITDEERAAMEAHSRLWIERAFRTDPIEPDKIVPAIHGIYRAAGLKRPRVIVVPSPLVMALAGGFASAIWYARNNGRHATDAATDAATRATRDATRDATDAATYAATDAATRAATYAATDAAARAATDAATYAARAATYAATDAATYGWPFALAEQTGGSRDMALFMLRCATRWYGPYQGGNMWASVESYITATRDILGLRLPAHDAYASWEQAAIHGGFRWMHDEFCLVCDFPEVLRTDEENRPHCEDGPSHRWRDGWSIYHWHGTRVPAEWIENKTHLSPTVALTHPNLEERRAAAEIIGWHRVLDELSATTIDADADPEIGTLVEVDIPEIGRERFIRVRCGTGRDFALPVPPEVQTAVEANAWTYGIPANLLKQKEFRT